MKIEVMSAIEACEYALAHYYPKEIPEFPHLHKRYAVISVQDAHLGGGFGIEFKKNQFCRDVLTLYFDDISHPLSKNDVCFTPEMAEKIMDFVFSNVEYIDTLIIHCYAGESRSQAIGMFFAEILGIEMTENRRNKNLGNRCVFETLYAVYDKNIEYRNWSNIIRQKQDI